MSSKKRKDKKGRILHTGELQLKNGMYSYRYTDKLGKRQCIYSWRLVFSDPTPEGKKQSLALRDMEAEIRRDIEDGLFSRDPRLVSLNDFWDKYISMKNDLKESRRADFNIDNQPIIDGYTNFVFRNLYGSVYNPDVINSAMGRIVKQYNEEETVAAEAEGREPFLLPHISAHNLRHTFCTRYCENESNLKLIQDTMGHADVTTTMQIYAHAIKEDIALVNSLLNWFAR